MNRRFVLALCGLLFAWTPAAAQDWPTKTVRIIVPFGPGSTPDIVGRLIGDHMQQKLGQPFVIENRPGASANTGTEMVAKADPDGYTIGSSLGGPLAINTLLFAKMPYDPAKDARRAYEPGRQFGRRTCRSTAEKSRQIQLRLDRQRLTVASGHGGACAQERHDDGARSLPRLAAGDDRGAAQRCADGLSAGDCGDATRRLRPGENFGHLARPTVGADAWDPDAQGERRRRRSGRLERLDRTGKNTGCGHRESSRRGR